jgi:hypothetical protein
MFSTPTAKRDFAIKAANAANRAIQRMECCKSQFKFRCFSCGEMINRGDKITKCTTASNDGMKLRFRGADSRNGLNVEETTFYQPKTGTRLWVHIGCIPCFWDSKSAKYSSPDIVCIRSCWDTKIAAEFEEWSEKTFLSGSAPYWCDFLEMHDYPEEKLMKYRIIYAVTRFQAIWRGYIYKRAYPLALLQKKEKALIDQYNNAELMSIADGRMAQFLRDSRNIHTVSPSKSPFRRIGRKVWCPFDCNTESESVFKGTITEIQYLQIGGVHSWYYTVTFQDGDVRNYDEKTLIRRIKQADEIIDQCLLSPIGKRFSSADKLANNSNIIYTKHWLSSGQRLNKVKNVTPCWVSDDDDY